MMAKNLSLCLPWPPSSSIVSNWQYKRNSNVNTLLTLPRNSVYDSMHGEAKSLSHTINQKARGRQSLRATSHTRLKARDMAF